MQRGIHQRRRQVFRTEENFPKISQPFVVEVEQELVGLLLMTDRELVDLNGGHGLDLLCRVGAAGLVGKEKRRIEGFGGIHTFSGS